MQRKLIALFLNMLILTLSTATGRNLYAASGKEKNPKVNLQQAIEYARAELRHRGYCRLSESEATADDNNSEWRKYIVDPAGGIEGAIREAEAGLVPRADSAVLKMRNDEFWAIEFTIKNASGSNEKDGGGGATVFVRRSNGKIIGVSFSR